MPTGYTAPIEEGKTTELKEFISDCARAFLIHLHDENSSSGLKRREYSDYYSKRVIETEKEFNNLKKLTVPQIKKLIKEEEEGSLRFHEKMTKEDMVKLLRCKKMLEKVKSWNIPTENHKELKDFALSQLQISIKDLCYERTPPIHLNYSPEEWRYEKTKELKEHLEDYQKEDEKEKKRVADANQYIDDLLESLK